MRRADDCEKCGARLKGVYVASVRVNKGSLRTTSTGVCYVLPTCDECDEPAPVPARWALDDESAAKVNAIRERKGWPPLNDPP